jgi:hypothetical protein
MVKFKGWLRHQRDRRDGVGDLARDLDRWLNPPRGDAPYEDYQSFLHGHGAPPAALDALAQAWREFGAWRRR